VSPPILIGFEGWECKRFVQEDQLAVAERKGDVTISIKLIAIPHPSQKEGNMSGKV
jgi:hypothetical protein